MRRLPAMGTKAHQRYQAEIRERQEAQELVGKLTELASRTSQVNEALHTAMSPTEIMALPEEFIEVVLVMRQPPKKEPRKRGQDATTDAHQAAD